MHGAPVLARARFAGLRGRLGHCRRRWPRPPPARYPSRTPLRARYPDAAEAWADRRRSLASRPRASVVRRPTRGCRAIRSRDCRRNSWCSPPCRCSPMLARRRYGRERAGNEHELATWHRREPRVGKACLRIGAQRVNGLTDRGHAHRRVPFSSVAEKHHKRDLCELSVVVAVKPCKFPGPALRGRDCRPALILPRGPALQSGAGGE